MRVIFDESFNSSDYFGDPHDNAAVPGRLASVMDVLRNEGRFAVEAPSPATRTDLLTGHSECHVAAIERFQRHENARAGNTASRSCATR